MTCTPITTSLESENDLFFYFMSGFYQKDSFEHFQEIGPSTDEQVYSENSNDEEYKKQLECLGTRMHGLKYQLTNLIFYDVWRRKRNGKISAPLKGFKWPVRPEALEKSYLTLHRSKTGKTKIFPMPLFRCINRRLEKNVKKSQKVDFECVQYKDNPLLEDISDELQKDPPPSVSIDQSYELHDILRDIVKKAWDQVKTENGRPADELDHEIGLEEPFLDKYLERTVAIRTQNQLSDLIDTLLDFRSRYPKQTEGDVRWYNLKGVSKLANIPQSAVERADARMKKLFPGIKDYGMQFVKEKEKNSVPKERLGTRLVRQYYDQYKKHRVKKE